MDDRTQHEIYAHPFLKSIMAGVASIMCSYSKFLSILCAAGLTSMSTDLINGTYACQNDKIMNDIVKREYGFQGCKCLMLC